MLLLFNIIIVIIIIIIIIIIFYIHLEESSNIIFFFTCNCFVIKTWEEIPFTCSFDRVHRRIHLDVDMETVYPLSTMETFYIPVSWVSKNEPCLQIWNERDDAY